MSSGLFSHWRKSLDFLRWPNFKLLIAATCNNAYRTNIILIKNFWPLLIGGIVVFVFFDFFLPNNNHLQSLLIRTVFSSIFVFLYNLAARPSLERKDFHYFLLYLPRFIILFPIFFLDFVLINFNYPVSALLFSFFTATMPFFYLDSSGSLEDLGKSFKQGATLSLYFFPVFFAAFCAFTIFLTSITLSTAILNFALQKIMSFSISAHINIAIFQLVLWFVLSIKTSFIVILYTKIKHSYSSLFFK